MKDPSVLEPQLYNKTPQIRMCDGMTSEECRNMELTNDLESIARGPEIR